MGLKLNGLLVLLREYFKSYLPVVRKSSPHTIRTYQVAIEQFLDYIKEKRGVKFYEITIEMINHDTVVAYLKYLDIVKGCCITTRNHRLNCINGFCKYASSFNLEAATCWHTIQLIKSPEVYDSPFFD